MANLKAAAATFAAVTHDLLLAMLPSPLPVTA